MQVEKYFYNFYWKIQKIIVPRLKYSQITYEEVLKESVREGCSWLDLGCGHQLLAPWRLDEEKKLTQRPKVLVGLDFDFPSLVKHQTIHYKLRGDISRLPFKDCSFDLVTANMVFEHLKEPAAQLREIFRILKPCGMLIFHTPNTRSYPLLLGRVIPDFLTEKVIYFLQGRSEEDVFPTHYRINNPSEIASLAESNGFSIVEINMISSTAQLIMIPPLVVFELLWIRLTMTSWLKSLRTNIIVKLLKPDPLL